MEEKSIEEVLKEFRENLRTTKRVLRKNVPLRSCWLDTTRLVQILNERTVYGRGSTSFY